MYGICHNNKSSMTCLLTILRFWLHFLISVNNTILIQQMVTVTCFAAYQHTFNKIVIDIHAYNWYCCRSINTYFMRWIQVFNPGIGIDTGIGRWYWCQYQIVVSVLIPNIGICASLLTSGTSMWSHPLKLDFISVVSSSAPQAPPPCSPRVLLAAPFDHRLLCRGYRGLLDGHLAVQDLRPKARLQRRRQPGESRGSDDDCTFNICGVSINLRIQCVIFWKGSLPDDAFRVYD